MSIWAAVGDILSPAIGVALSPLPVAGVILMLLSPRATRLAPAFLLGWMAAIAFTLGVITAFVDADALNDAPDEPSTLGIVIRIVLGALLVLLAVQQWRTRPKQGEPPEMPRWMQTIDSVSIPVAIGLGILLGGVNPKNLIFNLAAASSIVQADLPAGETVGAIAIYLVLASLSVVVPVCWYLLAKDAANAKLADLKNWLTQNNAVVMAVVFLVLGVSQIGKGLGGL